jgi:hypothetical protein
MPALQFTQVGNELQEASFGEILRSIAQGIADGQRALDLAAIQTLIVLANTPVSIIPEVTEVIPYHQFLISARCRRGRRRLHADRLRQRP